jgi:hypothetical protein
MSLVRKLTFFAHSVRGSFHGQKIVSKPVYGPHSATYAEVIFSNIDTLSH